MNRCRVTRQKYVGNSQHLLPHTPPTNLHPPTHHYTNPYPTPYILSPVSRLSSPVSHLPSPISRLSSRLVSRLRRKMTAGWGGVMLAASKGGWWPPGGEWRVSPQAEWVEDDRWVGRGEVGRQQGWMMTTRRRVESFTAGRMGGRWPLGGEGWGWPLAGAEDDH